MNRAPADCPLSLFILLVEIQPGTGLVSAAMSLNGNFELLAMIKRAAFHSLRERDFEELGLARRLRCDRQFHDLHFDLHRDVCFSEPVEATNRRLYNPGGPLAKFPEQHAADVVVALAEAPDVIDKRLVQKRLVVFPAVPRRTKPPSRQFALQRTKIACTVSRPPWSSSVAEPIAKASSY